MSFVMCYHINLDLFLSLCLGDISLRSRYLPGPDDMLVLDIAYMIYLKFEEYPNALQIALYLDNLQVCTLLELRMLF